MAGDDYQHLFTWFEALKLLRKNDCVERIEIEARGAGNVDDVVAHRRGRPSVYHQVKFVVDHREPLTHGWFTEAAGAARSPLERFLMSYVKLSTDEFPAELALVTNRPTDKDDPILKLVSGRDGTLRRLAAEKESSAAGKIRKSWAEQLSVSEVELQAMLDHLRIDAGLDDYARLREYCGYLMEAVGLSGDVDAVERGREEIRRIIIEEGCRELDRRGLEELIARKELHARERRVSLLVQQIDRAPLPNAASASVDWVDLHEGDEPRARRRLLDGEWWNERLRPELQRAAAETKQQGSDVMLVGYMRLSAGFAAGVELADVSGVRVSLQTRDGEWSTSNVKEFALADPHVDELGIGDELAVGLSVTGDLRNDVTDFLLAERIPVDRLITLMPADGVGDHSIRSGAEAMGFVHAVRAYVRGATKGYEGTLHLFLWAPLSVSVFLGHLWNRVPPTQLYEELGPTGGYQRTFFIPA